MRAKDLIKPLLAMSQEELSAHIAELRYLRTIEETTRKATTRKKATKTKVDKLEAMLKTMTPEQIAELMEKHG